MHMHLQTGGKLGHCLCKWFSVKYSECLPTPMINANLISISLHLLEAKNSLKFFQCHESNAHFFFWVSIIMPLFVRLVYQGKDIVFRFIIEYSSLRDFGP